MSFFTSIFSNAVSFISSVFFTKQDESEFDNLYLESDPPTGELVTLVPEDIPPQVPPEGLVEVPAESPAGLVVVEPTGQLQEPAVTDGPVDLLELHKNSILIPLYTNPISLNIYDVTTIQTDTEFNNLKSNFKGQVKKMLNKYNQEISKIEFCIEIVNPDDPVSYDYILNMNDDTKLGFINLKMYNTKEPTPFIKDNNKTQNYVTVTSNKIITISDNDMVNNIKNALVTLDNYITQKNTFKNTDVDDWKKMFLNKDELYTQRSKVTYQNYYIQNMTKSATDTKISPNVNLVMSYYYNPYTSNNYGISFSYVIAPVKTQKKTLLTQEMINTISDKLNTSTRIKGLFNSFGASKDQFILTQDEFIFNQAVIKIYESATLDGDKLTALRNKPHTLFTPNNLNTYLNILISMLDKPHDIIGKRVPEEIQKYMLNKVIAPNIENYIEYLKKILGSIPVPQGNITEFNNFIEFVKQMVFTFTNNTTKYVNSETTYENAIMLFVCKILETGSNITTGHNFSTELNTIVPINSLTNNNIVINPDIMYLTTDITDRVNQTNPNSAFRKYFSAPEVIDHGHVYNINNNTNIQFPENYKEIQLADEDDTSKYFTIHSYSETTNEPSSGSTTDLYYNVYVWFTQSTEENVPKCLIKYTIPFMKAPDCAGVYAGYKLIDYDDVKTLFTDIANNFTGLSDPMKALIPFIMLDQFYNAKSLQDDQNQLQVNQITTIPPVPLTTPNSVPTQFIGLCCDLTSAANGFNYYMSRQISQNPNSIVGYYHSNKKIWITDGNKIKFQIISAKKTASKDIFNVLIDILTNTTGGEKNHMGGVKRPADFDNNNPIVKKLAVEYNQYEYYYDEEDWKDDDTKIEEYGQYVYYNTMADWLYVDNNFKKYDLNLLFRQIEYDVNGKKYLSSNCFFDIFSNDFVKKIIEMLKIYSTQTNIQQQDVNKIIGKCAIYILTKFKLTPDNIVPPNEQIEISNDLDIEYKKTINNIINNHNANITQNNVGQGANNLEFSEKVFDRPPSPTGVYYDFSQNENSDSDMELGGGFYKKRTNKKKTNKKRTIKKRTIKKRTNKKKTNKKKIKRTIFKTRKIR
jgi:hypothetical protein